MLPPTAADVLDAAERLRPEIVHTPMLRNPMLDQLTGGTILLKPECLQRTGSFKLRGGTNAILQLDPAQRQAGVVAYSSGNHGQAVACAGAAAGIAVTVFMPKDAPTVKIESTRRWGAEVILYDRATEDRSALAQAHIARTGATLIPPYDHPHVIAGQGTLALELAQDATAAGLHIDALLVCTGGGGMVAGCALALAHASPATEIWAVEPQGSDDTARSLRSGHIESNPPGASTFCDSLLSPAPGAITFPINQARLKGGLVVTDDEVRAAMRFAFTHLKLVVEPGGAVALAAILSQKLPTQGRTIAAVLSGGNVDAPLFAQALAA